MIIICSYFIARVLSLPSFSSWSLSVVSAISVVELFLCVCLCALRAFVVDLLSGQDPLPDRGVELEHAASVPDDGLAILADDVVVVALGVEVGDGVDLPEFELAERGVAHSAGGGEQVALDARDGGAGQGVLVLGLEDLACGHRLARGEFGLDLTDID